MKNRAAIAGRRTATSAETFPDGFSPYTSRIIKAGALLSDTKTLLSCWDPERSTSENLERVRRQNLLGKSSRSRAADILAIFRQRYLTEEPVANALARLVKNHLNGETLERILYFHSTRADSLLRRFTFERRAEILY